METLKQLKSSLDYENGITPLEKWGPLAVVGAWLTATLLMMVLDVPQAGVGAYGALSAAAGWIIRNGADITSDNGP